MSRAADLGFLLEVVTRGRPSDARVAAVSDWQLVLDQAARSSIGPTLAAALATSPLPPAVANALADERAHTAAVNGLLWADFAVACKALHAAKLEFIALKGAALLLRGFVAPSARFLCDIDLRVAPDQIDRAMDALSMAGFQCTRTLDFAGRPDRSTDPNCRGPHGSLLELHPRSPGAPRRTFTAELADTVEIAVGDTRARVPTDDALLTGLSEHVLFHHAFELGLLARHLADVRALVDVGTRPRGLAAVASVRLLAAAQRSPERWAGLVFPPKGPAAVLYHLGWWKRVFRTTIDHPVSILLRAWPRATSPKQFGYDASLRGRLRRFANPFRPAPQRVDGDAPSL
jgi:hypothetical protein